MASANRIMIGAGAVFTETPFKGEDTVANPIPVLSAQFGPAYIEGLEAGLTLEPIKGPISPFASTFVAGRMTTARDRQDFSVDAGIRLGVRGELGELTAEYRHDITGEFDGGEFQLRYSYPIDMGSLRLIPSAQVNWLDQETADRMYGVTAAQRAKAIRKNRPIILPVAPITQAATNFGGSLSAVYALGGGVTLIGTMSGTHLDKSIYQSPAIDQRWECATVLAIAYSF
ncbi:MAG: MipA/OmpV family protein [Sphingomonadales bacterium]|nr:MipA/OmpV family protein [Sphingomonadales bacterium]MBD3774142.1 MipA/OmpV family protein [Paracoccaceae bacterium]